MDFYFLIRKNAFTHWHFISGTRWPLDILSNPNNFVTQMVKMNLTLDSSALRLIQYELFCNSSARVGQPFQVLLGMEWAGTQSNGWWLCKPFFLRHPAVGWKTLILVLLAQALHLILPRLTFSICLVNLLHTWHY